MAIGGSNYFNAQIGLEAIYEPLTHSSSGGVGKED